MSPRRTGAPCVASSAPSPQRWPLRIALPWARSGSWPVKAAALVVRALRRFRAAHSRRRRESRAQAPRTMLDECGQGAVEVRRDHGNRRPTCAASGRAPAWPCRTAAKTSHGTVTSRCRQELRSSRSVRTPDLRNHLITATTMRWRSEPGSRRRVPVLPAGSDTRDRPSAPPVGEAGETRSGPETQSESR